MTTNQDGAPQPSVSGNQAPPAPKAGALAGKRRRGGSAGAITALVDTPQPRTNQQDHPLGPAGDPALATPTDGDSALHGSAGDHPAVDASDQRGDSALQGADDTMMGEVRDERIVAGVRRTDLRSATDEVVDHNQRQPDLDVAALLSRDSDNLSAGQRKSGSTQDTASSSSPDEDEFPDDVDDPTYQTSIYVLPEARAAAKRDADRTGRLAASVAMDAIDEALRSGMLDYVVKLRHEVPRSEDSRFPSRSASRRRRSRHQPASKRALWQLFFTSAELAALDKIMNEARAKSRSELVSAALELQYLGMPDHNSPAIEDVPGPVVQQLDPPAQSR